MNKNGSFTALSSIIFVIVGLFLPLFLLAAYFIFNNPILRMLSLALAVALALLGFLYLPVRWPSSFHRLKSHLEQTESLLFTETVSSLKEEYQKACQQYEKLPEKKKEKCYGPLLHLREKIEELIQSTKRLETLAGEISLSTKERQQQCYEEMKELYQKLPRKEQKQWYPHLQRVREMFEH